MHKTCPMGKLESILLRFFRIAPRLSIRREKGYYYFYEKGIFSYYSIMYGYRPSWKRLRMKKQAKAYKYLNRIKWAISK